MTLIEADDVLYFIFFLLLALPVAIEMKKRFSNGMRRKKDIVLCWGAGLLIWFPSELTWAARHASVNTEAIERQGFLSAVIISIFFGSGIFFQYPLEEHMVKLVRNRIGVLFLRYSSSSIIPFLFAVPAIFWDLPRLAVMSLIMGFGTNLLYSLQKDPSAHAVLKFWLSRHKILFGFLFLSLALSITFSKVRTIAIRENPYGGSCAQGLINWRTGGTGFIKRWMGAYPENIDDFLSGLVKYEKESNLFLARKVGVFPFSHGHEDEYINSLFTCPAGAKKEISFEYFDPQNLKAGITRFVLLYEKPNNHYDPRNHDNYRSVFFNDGEKEFHPEEQVYQMLLAQSKSPNGFTWQPSTVTSPAESWYLLERNRKADARATIVTVLIGILAAGLILRTKINQGVGSQ